MGKRLYFNHEARLLLQQGVDLAVKERLIRRGFQVADWIEPRFIDAAQRQDQAVQAAR